MTNGTVPLVGIARGYKFAVLAAPDAPAAPGAAITLKAPYSVSATLPDGVLNTWRENLGRLHADELSKTRLFLWALRKSKTPGILDRENEILAEHSYRLYLGLLIGVPFFSNGRLTALTGANADGTARARTFTFYSRTYRTLGAPAPSLSAARLRTAADLAAALRKLNRSPLRWRMERCVRAFREACEADRLDTRLHQFVRCAEAFAALPRGKGAAEFAQRLGRLCVGRSRPALRELYGIRSGIEHLHGPYDRLPKRPAAGRFQRLLQRAIQSEIVARYLITVYLLNPSVWPYFKDEQSIQRFWALSDASLRAVWPTRLAFPKASSVLDKSAVRRHRSR